MKRNKIALLLIAAALLSVCFTACGKNDATSETPKEPATLQSICAAIEGKMDNATALTNREDSFVENFMQLDASALSEYRIKAQTEGGSIDEYGVLRVKSGESTEAIEETVRNYLDFYLNTLWDDRYKPEEKPKIENASYKVFGNEYVVYLIMDKSVQSDVYTALGKLF